MTISAFEDSSPADRLARNLELYRDLSVALLGRITLLKAGGDPEAKEVAAALAGQRKALQAVLELEASLVKRSGSRTDGEGRELDLDAARAEILERLAVWSAERGTGGVS